MKRTISTTRSRQDGSRDGSTLTEVLVAMMIMSIGLVSLTTMFPLSVLRSIKASQLTKATDLRYNAETMLTLNPKIVSDPDLNALTTTVPEFYVIDPLGWASMNVANAALSPSFGNVNGTAFQISFTGLINSGGTNRYSFQPGTLAAALAVRTAENRVTLPDSWEVVYEGPAVNPVEGNGVAGYTQLDVTGLTGEGIALSPTITYRAIIFSADGLQTQTRVLTLITGDRIAWTEDLDDSGALNGAEDLNGNGILDTYPLPGDPPGATFVPGQVRIESADRRYTWLLTCRKATANNSADVDVVVFFGRSVENQTVDEALYDARFTVGRAQASATYTGPQPPPVKRGGYVFDANNARWYRLSGVTAASGTINMLLESPAISSSPAGAGKAMFPKGVVDVYPLGTKDVVIP